MTGRPTRGIVVIDSAVLDGTALDRWVGQARPRHARIRTRHAGSSISAKNRPASLSRSP
jgi:hypothetical protein